MKTKSIVLTLVIFISITPSLFAGEIIAWGRNVEGQCDVNDGNDFVAVAAGFWPCPCLTPIRGALP